MFREARLKVERANKHILDFDTNAVEFFKSSGYQISIDTDSETLDDIVKVDAVSTLPPEFALILGDALHNLRSALDIGWFVLAGGDAPKPEREVFPVMWTDKALEDHIKKRPEQYSLIRFADTLTKVIQPYKGGNGHDLWVLHKLDSRDKHQLLIPQVHLATLYGFFVEDDKGERHGITKRTFSEKRPLILRHSGSRNLKVVKEGTCHATVVFGVGTAVPGLWSRLSSANSRKRFFALSKSWRAFTTWTS